MDEIVVVVILIGAAFFMFVYPMFVFSVSQEEQTVVSSSWIPDGYSVSWEEGRENVKIFSSTDSYWERTLSQNETVILPTGEEITFVGFGPANGNFSPAPLFIVKE